MFNYRLIFLVSLLGLAACASQTTMNSHKEALASMAERVDGSNAMFSTLTPLPAGNELAAYGYEANEYFVSGNANGKPYKTRIVIRQPADMSNFQGMIMTEPTHPSEQALEFYFNHRYLMDSGYIGVDIYTNDVAKLKEHDPQRYSDVVFDPEQRSEVLAQVGMLLKTDRIDNPLAGSGLRKMILTGTSASADMLIEYLPTHVNTRLADGGPIYDGFIPASADVESQFVDVPSIQLHTLTEMETGLSFTRQDSDAPGEQYRLYETAGIAHLDSREADSVVDGKCVEPVSMHPFGPGFSTALHHLFQWADQGILPPRAERIAVDGDVSNDGSLMALDQYGNAQGGFPSPYVNVPVAKYGAPNSALEGTPPIFELLCSLAGYQHNLSPDQLSSIYATKDNYLDQVRDEVDRLISEGWLLPVDAALVLSDAEDVEF